MKKLRLFFLVVVFLCSFSAAYFASAATYAPNQTLSPLTILFSTDSHNLPESPLSILFSTDSHNLQETLSAISSANVHPVAYVYYYSPAPAKPNSEVNITGSWWDDTPPLKNLTICIYAPDGSLVVNNASVYALSTPTTTQINWYYTFTPTQEGWYRIVIYAIDQYGAQAYDDLPLLVTSQKLPLFLHYRVITISGTHPGGYQLFVNLTNFTLTSADPNATWFFANYSNHMIPLPIWVDKWKGNLAGEAKEFWVRIPRWCTNLYVYYGSTPTISSINGSAVFDYFDDMETWTGWVTLGSGIVSQDTTHVYHGSYAAHKSTYNNPNGAYKSLGRNFSRDIILEFFVYRPSGYVGGAWDRAGLSDASGNGYGWGFDHGYNNLAVESWAAWTATPTTTSGAAFLDAWAEGRLILTPSSVTAEEILNGTLKASVSISDTTYTRFDHFFIVGGYDFWVDEVRIRKYADPEPTISVGSEKLLDIPPKNPSYLIYQPSPPFHRNDTVYIYASPSDQDDGFANLTIEYSIYAPNGTPLILSAPETGRNTTTSYYRWTVPSNAPLGTYTVKLNSTDPHGVSNVTAYTFTVAGYAPSIKYMNTNASACYPNQTIHFAVGVSDADNPLPQHQVFISVRNPNYVWLAKNASMTLSGINFVYDLHLANASSGYYLVQVVAKDYDGLSTVQNYPDAFQVVVPPTTPPTPPIPPTNETNMTNFTTVTNKTKLNLTNVTPVHHMVGGGGGGSLLAPVIQDMFRRMEVNLTNPLGISSPRSLPRENSTTHANVRIVFLDRSNVIWNGREVVRFRFQLQELSGVPTVVYLHFTNFTANMTHAVLSDDSKVEVLSGSATVRISLLPYEKAVLNVYTPDGPSGSLLAGILRHLANPAFWTLTYCGIPIYLVVALLLCLLALAVYYAYKKMKKTASSFARFAYHGWAFRSARGS